MSSGSSPPAGKKRKKPDSKPLSQLTKCINEKRRREQENVYIEELAELISASNTDMSSISVKPDKCAILQETVNQIRRIKEETDGSGNDVQEGEVSSSKPAILSDQLLGTFLLEALDGFLFVVNTEGKVEYVSDNVSSFLRYTPDDLIGKSVYNIIHVGDHARFSSSLLPTSLGWCSDLPSSTRSRIFNCRLLIKPPSDDEETMEEKQTRVSQYETMQISAILQYPGEKSEHGHDSEGGENQNCLVCVTRRIPASEKHPALSAGGPPVEQFTTKLDVNGKVLAIDTSGVSSTYSQYLNKDLVGCIIHELCHPSDLTKIASHLKETLQSGQSTSSVYRLSVTPPNPYESHLSVGADKGQYIHVQTKSKRFPYNPGTTDMEFIMATHSILSENEFKAPETPGSSVRRPDMGSMSSLRLTEGNPVLTSVVRGGKPKLKLEPCEVLEPNIAMNSGTSFSSSYTDLNLNGFDFELFPTSTWDLNLGAAEEEPPPLTTSLAPLGPPSTPTQFDGAVGSWNSPARPSSLSRPNSRQSSTTPRPPSVPAYSPATNLTGNPPSVSGPHSVPSPGTFNVPSPASRRHPSGSILLDNLTSPLGTAHHYPSTPQHHPSPGAVNSQYPFSPMLERPGSNQPEDTKEGLPGLLVARTPSGMNDLTESNRLREILERPSSGSALSSMGYGVSEEGKVVEIKKESDSSGCGGRQQQSVGRKFNQDNQEDKRSSGPNAQHEILLSLLKDHNDDDESKAGVKKQNEILESLLSDTSDRKQDSAQQERNDELLKSLMGFQPGQGSSRPQPSLGCDSPNLMRGMKRPGDELNADPSKSLKLESSQGVNLSQAQQQQQSKLCEKNKMLASLLAKAPTQVPTIPQNVPSPKPSALPQEKLPKNLKDKLNHDTLAQNLTSGQSNSQTPRPLGGTQSQLQALQRQQSNENSFLNALLVRPSGQVNQSVNSNQLSTSAQKVLVSGQQVQLQANVHPNGGMNISLVQSSVRVGGGVPARGRTVLENFVGDVNSSVEALPWEAAGGNPAPSLSDILDQLIDMEPSFEQQADSPPVLAQSPLPDVNERLAINAIQKSLMSIETIAQPSQNAASNNLQNSLSSLGSALAGGGTVRISQLGQLGVVQAGNGQITANQAQQLLLQQRNQKILAARQQQQARLAQVQQIRLQQQQQQLRLHVQQVGSQQQAAQLSPNSLASIEDLLNASNPPNVSLQQRSDPPQTSPGFSSPLLSSPGGNNQISPNPPRPSYSPHDQGSNFNQGIGIGAARSSPLGSLTAFQQTQGTIRASQVGSLSASSLTTGLRQIQQQQQQSQNQLQFSTGLSNPRAVNSPRAVTPRSLSTTSPGPSTPLTPQARQSPFSVGGESPLPSPTSGYLPQHQQLRLQRMGGGPILQGGPPPYRPHGYPHYPYPPYPMSYRHYDPSYPPFCYQDPARPLYQYDSRIPHVPVSRYEPAAYPSPPEAGGGGNVANTYSERIDGDLAVASASVESSFERRPLGGVATAINAATSLPKQEYVRQELRAVVGARNSSSQPPQSPSQSILSATLASPRGPQTHQIMGQQVRVQPRNGPPPQMTSHTLTQSELEALGITLELPQSNSDNGGGSTLSWESFGNYNPEDMITLQAAPSENASQEPKNSLLEQLLNETKEL